MKIEAIAFTALGEQTAQTIAQRLVSGHKVGLSRGGQDGLTARAWAARWFGEADALVFVGAAGIAVRSIAPLVRAKTVDPAVLVVDEGCRFVVPILSGHLGGANELAVQLAKELGARAVVTTATDGRGLFAVDVWARAQGLFIANPAGIRKVSAALLAGDEATMYSPFAIAGIVPEGLRVTRTPGTKTHIRLDVCGPVAAKEDVQIEEHRDEPLWLVPRAVYLGIGCKRGTSNEAIEAAYQALLKEHHIHPEAVVGAATVALKQNEPGLLAFCEQHSLQLEVFEAEELAELPGAFQSSEFVRQTAGVDNVCERSAMAGRGKLLAPKTTGNGVALALALKIPALTFETAKMEEP